LIERKGEEGTYRATELGCLVLERKPEGLDDEFLQSVPEWRAWRDVQDSSRATPLPRSPVTQLTSGIALNEDRVKAAIRLFTWIYGEEGFASERVRIQRLASLHYHGQSFDLTVPVADGPLDARRLAEHDALFRLGGAEAQGPVTGHAHHPPPLVEPTIDGDGLVVIPPSLFLFGFEGMARTVVEPVLGDPIVEQAIRGIDLAAERDGVLHLWLHPNDLVTGPAVDRLERILSHLRKRLEDSPLAVETMRDVAARIHDHPESRRGAVVGPA
jgi:hypothetical protein